MSGTSPIRIAIFGNGFARTTILPCLRHVEGARVVGIASPSIDRARETATAFGIPVAAAEHREILASCSPDLVFVATPPHRHREMAIDALRAGCHVVCEKPTALDAGESRAMRDAARASGGRLAWIDHELRFLPTRVALRERIAGGHCGTIVKAEYLLHSPGRRDPSLPWSWWSDADRGGGALGAIGSHAIDALRVLMGEVVEARGWLETVHRARRDPRSGETRPVTSDDIACAWLRFSSGAMATITISTVEAARAHRILVTGSSGSAALDEQGPLWFTADGKSWSEVPVVDELPSSDALGIPDTDWARAFIRLARAAVATIRAGRTAYPGAPPRPVPDAATFEDGHRTQLICDAIRLSAASGGWTHIED